MRTAALTAVLFILMMTSAVALTGKCVAVLDGDSVKIVLDDYPILVQVRLFGVDCPDQGQPFAEEAAKFTADKILEKPVTIEPLVLDRYGRTVAWVNVDGKSVNHALVEAGLGWWFKHFAPGERMLERLEREPRRSKRGLWARPNPIPPWKWRFHQGPAYPNDRMPSR